VRLCAFSLAISRRALLGIRIWVVPQARIAPDYPISASIKKLRAGESWKTWQAAWSGWVHIPAHHHHFRFAVIAGNDGELQHPWPHFGKTGVEISLLFMEHSGNIRAESGQLMSWSEFLG
jgi:hypothetical protein